MSALKVNLLPPEVIEKRRYEKLLSYLLILFVFLIALLAVFYGFNTVRLNNLNIDLADLKLQTTKVAKDISNIEKYEQLKLKLEQQEQTLKTATADVRPWLRFLNDLSLVMPNEAWLTALNLNKDSVNFSAQVLTDAKGNPTNVAKLLVRLETLKDLTDIWTQGLAKPSQEGESTETTGPKVMDIGVTAKLKPLESAAPAAPAPPSGGTQ